ncbi:MAG: cadherin-like domain-containing protein, partial [Pseudomonadota bacterium]
GDETGYWTSNISIDNEGLLRLDKDHSDVQAFDLGRSGTGFWFAGRLIEAQDNVAAGARTGFVWMSRGDTADVDPQTYDQPEALGVGRDARTSDPVIRNFNGNEVFGSEHGLTVIKGDPTQGHDLRTVMTDFTAWEVRSGVHIEYSSHYTLRDFDLVAVQDPPQYTTPAVGIKTGNNTSDIVVSDASIDGFTYAYNFTGRFTSGNVRDEDKRYVVEGGESVNLLQREFQRGDYRQRVDEIADAAPGELRLDVDVNDIGGRSRAVVFDGEKTDSLGTIPVPSGNDRYALSYEDVREIVRTDGFYTLDGKQVFVAEAYYEDRLTGEIEKIGHLVEAQGEVFGTPRGVFSDAVYKGELDPDNRAPVARGERAQTREERSVDIALLANDRDPDGDEISVDGILQPTRGRVVDNGDGTVTYTPDIGFIGRDEFEYWVTDGFGAFTKASTIVDVRPADPTRATETPFLGTNGSDVLDGTSDGDRMVGGLDDDSLKGRAGDDTLGGGSGADILKGGRGADVLKGAGGSDRLNGQGGDDSVRSGAGEDVARGAGGDDALSGQGGRDKLLGGAGSDFLKGGAGADVLKGGGGRDVLRGGLGDDTLSGGGGDDALIGGDGEDVFFFGANAGGDLIADFEDGVDRIEIAAGGFASLKIEDTLGGASVEHAGGRIKLTGVDAEDLDASDFIF